ncbi:MAG: tRNA preQ1(34) S-adenosylmethionine ribosyltransferase-isomerase QueA [Burkholderiales bacterium]|nr:tRNA preQ1(34) S-adenosylmethionine ribosyltransferase-isomerase QueA [Burkholderiales bacterium]
MEKEQYLSDFDFDLPEELIAQYPLAKRSSSRLLHVWGRSFEDLTFEDLPSLLHEGDLLVFNNTKVIKARLNGYKESGGAIEALLERITGTHTVITMMKASKSPKPGTAVYFEKPGVEGRAKAWVEGRTGEFYNLRFEQPVLEVLDTFGKVPLPPYITHAAAPSDEDRYQTVYAKEPGAVAAPTAGLHFTSELLQAIKAKGCEEVFVTLHVGAGTFQPVRVENLSQHVMHSEHYTIDSETASKINKAMKEGRRIVCVGTTSLRTVESAAALTQDGLMPVGSYETRLFIKPGYKFRVCDALITNFHLPKSTLIMLVSALAGKEEVFTAYRHAIQEKYRFFSYGDACFFERKEC